MPRLDGTGPSGKGSKTGRGLGKCNSNNQQNAMFTNIQNQERPILRQERRRTNRKGNR